jgi:hypothetical protein
MGPMPSTTAGSPVFAASSSSSARAGTVTTTVARIPDAAAGVAVVVPSMSRSHTTSART